MKVLVILSLCMATATTSFAGALSGTVKAQPKPELAGAAGPGAGKYDSRQFKFVETVKYDQIKDFVVYVEGVMTNMAFATPARDVITQKDAMFHPHVMP